MKDCVDYLHDIRRKYVCELAGFYFHQSLSLPPLPRTLELSGAFFEPPPACPSVDRSHNEADRKSLFRDPDEENASYIYIYTFMQKKRNQNSKCETRRKEQKKHLACHPYNTVKAKEKKQETSPKDGIPPLPKSRYNTNCQPRKGNKEDKGKK